MRRIGTMLLLGLLAGPPAAFGQEPSVEAGTRLLQEERWAEAAEAFRGVTAREPDNGVAWYRLGMALQEGGDPDGAIAALERAAELGFQAPYARARMGRAHATLGHADAALSALEAAVEAGLDAPALLEHPQLASLSDDARFRTVLEATRRASEPCAHIPEYRAFDFWIGEWEVRNPAGQTIGENRIVPLLNGCGLQENWTDAQGNEGKSLNAFDRTMGIWRQLWVSDRGNVTDYGIGRVREDGALEFDAEVKNPAGETGHLRMVFTPVAPDTVRQEIFQSDDGEQWTSAWLGIYVRKGS